MVSSLRDRGITFKLVFCILSSCAIIFTVVFGYNYGVSRGILITRIEDVASNLTSAAVSKIEATLLPIEKVPEQLAHTVERSSYTKDELKDFLYSVVERNPDIYGATIALEPYVLDQTTAAFAPYFYRKEGRIEYVDLATDQYVYLERDWYTTPRKLKQPVWSEPYFDTGGGGILMTTYSVPIYRTTNKKQIIGVVTADLSLTWLQKYVSSIKVGKTGYGFLVSGKGALLTHPEKDLVMDKTLADVAKIRNNPALLKVGGQMLQGEVGFAPVKNTLTKKETWIAFAPIPTTRWSLAVIFPKGELMADLHALNRAVLLIGLTGLLFLAVVIILLSNSIIRPLRVLALKTKDVGSGKLDFDLPPPTSRDEVGSLTESFRYMKDALKKYIEELTKTTSEKERIQSELKIAHNIQMGILPKVFPPFPDRTEFDIHAVMKPAKEVGGDFYDFYFIDNDRIFLVIGDVADKGVPAAFFMALTKTYTKSVAKMIKDPGGVLYNVNKELARDNETGMFVTAFCCILNVKTGEFFYSNAGHNPPFIVRKGKDPEFLAGDSGIALGAFDNVFFGDEKLTLDPGDTLYMYTDGVTEAANSGDELFSEEKLKRGISKHREATTRELVEGTMRGIESFAGGAPQSDDITIMVLRYYGKERPQTQPGKGEEITIKNDLSEIEKLADAVDGFGKKNGLSGDMINDTNLALEEIVNNIISYAYGDDKKHQITLSLNVKGSQLLLEVTDDGKPFDPLSVPEPDIDTPIAKKKEGGLGIFLTRALMDKIEYRRESEKNILLMKRNFGDTTLN